MTAELNMATVLDEMPETTVVTPEVLQQIIASIGNQPVSDYAQAIPFTFIGVVKTALPDVTDKAQRKLIADELHAYLVESGFIGGTTAPAAAPQGSIEVTVKQEKTFDTMRLPQLLAALAEDPGCYSEVYPSFVAPNPQFAKALAKANNGKVAVLTADGKLDVAGTVAHIEHLNDDAGQPQPNWRGSKLTTLDKALGRKASVMFNFLTGESMKDGLDPFGKDWTTMDEKVYRAGAYAVLTGKIEPPQGSSDVRRWTIELFTSPLPAMWQGLVEEFEQAVEDEDPRTMLFNLPLSAIHTALVELDRQAQGGKVTAASPAAAPKLELTEDDYKAKLYDAAESHISEGGSLSRNGGIIKSFRVDGSCTLNGTIVLEGGKIGGSSRGMCYVPTGYSVRADGGNNMRVFERSYKKLCEIAGLI